MSDVLRTERSASILRLTMDDPKSRNSLSETMLADLSAALAAAENDGEVAVIILAAVGPAFCSGHNLKELSVRRRDKDSGATYFAQIFERCSNLMMQIRRHRCAVIAEVAGLASAAGCQLVASCDLAYASNKASFCTPGVNIGLFCSTPMVALSGSIASKHAMEMLLTGEVYDADYAYRVGLVNGIVEPQDLTLHVAAVAQKIAAKSSTAIGYGKKLMAALHDVELANFYRKSSEVMVNNLLDVDAREGIDAVLQKRPAHWSKGELR